MASSVWEEALGDPTLLHRVWGNGIPLQRNPKPERQAPHDQNLVGIAHRSGSQGTPQYGEGCHPSVHQTVPHSWMTQLQTASHQIKCHLLAQWHLSQNVLVTPELQMIHVHPCLPNSTHDILFLCNFQRLPSVIFCCYLSRERERAPTKYKRIYYNCINY